MARIEVHQLFFALTRLLLFGKESLVDQARQNSTDDGRKPEYPELGNSPVTNK